MPKATKETLRCSFCHKPVSEVAKLIGSPSQLYPPAYICDQCVAVCHSVCSGGTPDKNSEKP